MRTVTNLPGSSLFPSWLRDGRLFFNYDGDDYRGFVIASDFMNVPTRPLRADRGHVPSNLAWKDLFPETPVPAQNLEPGMVWRTWSAHSPGADLAAADTRVLRRSGERYRRDDGDRASHTAR